MSRTLQLVIGGVIVAAILIGILIQGFESTVFFYTPSEILAAPGKFAGKLVRIGALVQKDSTRWNDEALRLEFGITEDTRSVIPVVFEGVKPDMYREGQGVVVEGRLDGGGVFRADTLLVKHSEEYNIDESKGMDKERMVRSLMNKER